MKALIVVRLSRVTDATTSPERQLQICQDLCVQRGYEVVGVAEDLDVSGAVDPFDRKKRPNLARWLSDEERPFDVLVAYRVDRLTRSIRNLQELVHWADDHGKLVVSATEPHFDTTSPFAAVVIALMGTVAQMELDAIRERTASAARYNLRAGKYRGSLPPWGYLPEKVDGDWRLVQNPEQVRIIHEVYHRIVEGHESLQSIAHDLTRRGVLTPKDSFAELRGRPVAGREWSVTPLKRALLSETMLGYAVSKEKAIRDADGSPIVRSDPIFTREQFEALKAELASRAVRGEPTRVSSSLLLRVLHCGVCGLPAYKFNGGSHAQFPRYRCKSMTKAAKCGNGTVAVPEFDAFATEQVLEFLGDSERLERVWEAGSDNAAELAEINAELVDLTGLIGSPAYRVGSPQRVALDARIEALAARQEALQDEETRPSGWTWKPTGEKLADWWDAQDVEARNTWLRTMNVRLMYDTRGGTMRRSIDFGDLRDYEKFLRLGPTARAALRRTTGAVNPS
ncbi:recombinase family protein [Mycolicibacterium houstonense]|uniref:recombinase family protein n=1 Tax=Mycolicibacterium houstonense TaxID=146021 RepID=UPI000829B485|nr:recombinase family protein [Mycolicibacterium houstonense]